MCNVLGERLKEIRRQRGLSQEAAAVELGVHWTTLIRWEHGERNPQGNNRRALERWLSAGDEQAGPEAA